MPGLGYRWSSFGDYEKNRSGLTDAQLIKGVSVRQLNRLTGTPRGVIERIIAKERSS